MTTVLYALLFALVLLGLLWAAWRVHLKRTAEHHDETMTRIEDLRQSSYRDDVPGRHRIAEITTQFEAVQDVPQHDGHRRFVPWEEVKAKKAALDVRRNQEEQ